MLFVHQTRCLSPQQTFPETDLSILKGPADNRLLVQEPAYAGIPPGMLRRMGKAVRMSVGLAMPLLEQVPQPDGILIGTANGGMEDSIKFLNQLIEYNEGLLTPGNFVQSTANAPAAQIALISGNRHYNCTYTHRGLAFENALLDACMLLQENPGHTYLLGSVEEISSYNYNIDRLAGCFKEETISNSDLYRPGSSGTLAGEGALMTIVSGRPEGALAQVEDLQTIHTGDERLLLREAGQFLRRNGLDEGSVDLLLSGENGDSRLEPYYRQMESLFPPHAAIARFKHLCGEYCTASAFGFWLATEILRRKTIPEIAIKRPGRSSCECVLLYNNYRGLQHAFILLRAMPPSGAPV